MSLSLDLGVGLGSPPSSVVAPAINPNLLTKTEQFNAAAWVKTNCFVTADAGTDPLGGSTADLLDMSFGIGAQCSQTTTVACTTATGSANTNLTPTPTRFSVTGSVDGSPYTWSLWLSDPASTAVQLRFDAAGGFVKVTVKDVGDGATPLAWGAKLETGSSSTGDASSYGAVA